jgi:hypothetical protein
LDVILFRQTQLNQILNFHVLQVLHFRNVHQFILLPRSKGFTSGLPTVTFEPDFTFSYIKTVTFENPFIQFGISC